MEEAARLAKEGVENGEGGPFGAVVVRNGKVVGAACNRVLATNDPTAHAEIEAIREAARELGRFHLDDCVLYTTCEPCPMCLGAIHWARMARVVYAMTRHDAADIGFHDADIYDGMEKSRVPMTRVGNEAAAEAFRVWTDKTDRTEY